MDNELLRCFSILWKLFQQFALYQYRCKLKYLLRQQSINLAPVQETASNKPEMVQAKSVQEMARLAAVGMAPVKAAVSEWVKT